MPASLQPPTTTQKCSVSWHCMLIAEGVLGVQRHVGMRVETSWLHRVPRAAPHRAEDGREDGPQRSALVTTLQCVNICIKKVAEPQTLLVRAGVPGLNIVSELQREGAHGSGGRQVVCSPVLSLWKMEDTRHVKPDGC